MKKTLSILTVFGLMLTATPAFAWGGSYSQCQPQCHPIRCNPAPIAAPCVPHFSVPCLPTPSNCQPVHCRH